MKRDVYVERMLQGYSRSIEFAGKQRVLARLTEASDDKRAAERGRKGRKAVLALAAVLILTTATVFADDIVQVIRKVAFGKVNAVQQDALSPTEDGERVTSNTKVYLQIDEPISQADRDAIDQWEDIEVYDMDEVRSMLDFVREPAWLPERYVFDHAQITVFPSGQVWKDASLIYRIPEYHALNQIVVDQSYVGDTGMIDMQTIDSIEQTKVGDSDALMRVMSDSAYVELWWINDGVAYNVGGDHEEEVRKIAESIPAVHGG